MLLANNTDFCSSFYLFKVIAHFGLIFVFDRGLTSCEHTRWGWTRKLTETKYAFHQLQTPLYVIAQRTFGCHEPFIPRSRVCQTARLYFLSCITLSYFLSQPLNVILPMRCSVGTGMIGWWRHLRCRRTKLLASDKVNTDGWDVLTWLGGGGGG